MAEKADFYVENVFKDGFEVVRKLRDGIEDIRRPCALRGTEMVPLNDTETSISIKAPRGMDIKECPIKVRADVDLCIVMSRSNASWEFKIIPGSLPPEAPTTVNVTIGEDET